MPQSPAINNHPRFRRLWAFTLLEMLVSLVLMAILIILLASWMNGASDAWLAGEGRAQRNQNGRAIADMVRRELQGALVPVQPSNLLGLQFVVNPPSLTGGNNLNSSAVFWQAPMAIDQQFGDVAEFGYFVAWDSLHPQLRRFYASLKTRDAHGSLILNPNFRIHTEPSNWITNDILADVCPATADKNYEGLFAENVLGLWIRCLDSEGNRITEDAKGASYSGDFDSRRGYQYSDSTNQKIIKGPGVLPPVVEISLALLDARASRRINETLKQRIQKTAKETTTASEFVTAALRDATFTPIRSGLYSYTTTVFLQNSR